MIKVEPYWNVNDFLDNSFKVNLFIKVEPYWNVNVLVPGLLVDAPLIKVEPYWNINANIKVSKFILIPIKVEPYWNVNIITRAYCMEIGDVRNYDMDIEHIEDKFDIYEVNTIYDKCGWDRAPIR